MGCWALSDRQRQLVQRLADLKENISAAALVFADVFLYKASVATSAKLSAQEPAAKTPAAVHQGRLHIKAERGEGYLKTEDLVIPPSNDTIAQVFNISFVPLDKATIITLAANGTVTLANKWQLAVPAEDNTVLFFDKPEDNFGRGDLDVTCRVKDTAFACQTINGRNAFQICSYPGENIEGLVLADLSKPDPDQVCTPATLSFERIEYVV